MTMYRVSIITVSDSGFAGTREDRSGPAIRQAMEAAGYAVGGLFLLPDDRAQIAALLRQLCDENAADLILTTGGTGLSPRDWTPEATMDIAQRMVPGIAEAMRYYSLQITPRAMLSRAVSAIREKTLIINLPGSPKAVTECLHFLLPTLEHGLDTLTGRAENCGRKE